MSLGIDAFLRDITRPRSSKNLYFSQLAGGQFGLYTLGYAPMLETICAVVMATPPATRSGAELVFIE